MNDLREPGRTVLAVVAPCSASGKTLFITHLLRCVGGLGCLKISREHDEPRRAAACETTTEQDFFLEDSNRLGVPGKDTAVYLSAGAARVEWLRYRGNGLAAGVRAALERFPSRMPVVIESSSAVRLLEPAGVFLVVRPPIREMKPQTGSVLSHVSDLLVNTADREISPTTHTGRLLEHYPVLHPRFVWSADLAGGRLPEELLVRLRDLAASSTEDCVS